MRYGSAALVLTLAAAAGIAAFAVTYAARNPTAASASEPGSYAPPHTGWGDPDFQGVWRYEAAIALERPGRFAGRQRLTDAEVAEAERLEKDLEA